MAGVTERWLSRNTSTDHLSHRLLLDDDFDAVLKVVQHQPEDVMEQDPRCAAKQDWVFVAVVFLQAANDEAPEEGLREKELVTARQEQLPGHFARHSVCLRFIGDFRHKRWNEELPRRRLLDSHRLVRVEDKRKLLHQREEKAAVAAIFDVLRPFLAEAFLPQVPGQMLEENTAVLEEVELLPQTLVLPALGDGNEESRDHLQEPLDVDDDSVAELWVLGIMQDVTKVVVELQHLLHLLALDAANHPGNLLHLAKGQPRQAFSPGEATNSGSEWQPSQRNLLFQLIFHFVDDFVAQTDDRVVLIRRPRQRVVHEDDLLDVVGVRLAGSICPDVVFDFSETSRPMLQWDLVNLRANDVHRSVGASCHLVNKKKTEHFGKIGRVGVCLNLSVRVRVIVHAHASVCVCVRVCVRVFVCMRARE